ncbi:zinc ribbon domain-containing protein [Streptomyces sp. NRRL S-646]|uniref:zinc ribbon domain-containing protein n=1 Tax=Streptomyces sp. NRRL S-646 TaxID=1463917 RepID=UPI0022773A85|nr:zinc ribbon domain-containing protein [Streptomyces sp. NRRL S-646]
MWRPSTAPSWSKTSTSPACSRTGASPARSPTLDSGRPAACSPTRQRNACRTVVANRWYPSSKTCSGCGVVKAKLPLHIRTFECDACGLVLDRDANAALNLAALAAAAVTGTGVAGDLDTPKVSKPRGADHKTRTTRPSRKATAERAGVATLPHQRQTETRDRTQIEALTLW